MALIAGVVVAAIVVLCSGTLAYWRFKRRQSERGTRLGDERLLDPTLDASHSVQGTASAAPRSSDRADADSRLLHLIKGLAAGAMSERDRATASFPASSPSK